MAIVIIGTIDCSYFVGSIKLNLSVRKMYEFFQATLIAERFTKTASADKSFLHCGNPQLLKAFALANAFCSFRVDLGRG